MNKNICDCPQGGWSHDFCFTVITNGCTHDSKSICYFLKDLLKSSIKRKNTRAILEISIPMELEFVFLEHGLYKLIEVWNIYRKNSKYNLKWHNATVNKSHVITRPEHHKRNSILF